MRRRRPSQTAWFPFQVPPGRVRPRRILCLVLIPLAGCAGGGAPPNPDLSIVTDLGFGQDDLATDDATTSTDDGTMGQDAADLAKHTVVPSFAAVVDYPVMDSDRSVAVADFDRDGNLDLAVSTQENGIAILLGKPNGAFGIVSYPTEHVPFDHLVAADMNRDGRQDLVAVLAGEPQTNGLTIFLGNGDGTFQMVRKWPERDASYQVVGDFNVDGKLDVALAQFQGKTVDVFLGNGDGTLQAPQKTPGLIMSPTLLSAADADGDGKIDLFVGYNGRYVSVLKGNGDGTFRSPIDTLVGDQIWDLAFSDFNRDGKLDFATCDTIKAVNIFSGYGDGSFSKTATYNVAEAGNIAGADVDGDGVLDLVVGTSAGAIAGSISVLLGKPNGSFSIWGGLFPLNLPPYQIVPGDFNHDGKPDIAVGAHYMAGVSVLLNTSR